MDSVCFIVNLALWVFRHFCSLSVFISSWKCTFICRCFENVHNCLWSKM